MFKRSSKKLGLDQAIFLTGDFNNETEGFKNKNEINKLTPKEVELLLKKGMIGLFQD